MKKLNKLMIASICVAAITPVIIPCATEAATKNESLESAKEQDKQKKENLKNKNGSIPDTTKYKIIKIEGEDIYVSKKGNEWINRNGYWHFVKDGQLIKGWRQMTRSDGEKTAHWSYFDSKNGRLYAGWHRMGKAEGEKTEHWSYFGGNGWLRTGWVQLGKGTSEPDGNSEKHWSYFGGNGWLRTGWVQLGKGTSEPDGNSEKHWSYFGGNGWLRTGWVQLGKGTSEPDGNSAKHWSYFGGNGWLRTGMQTMGTSANPDGKNKQHLSYFGGNGWLVENKELTLNKVQYIADSRGWLNQVKTEYDKTLVRAYRFVANVTNNSMTKEQKLRACYNHIKNSYPETRPRTPHYAGKDWPVVYANDIFINKNGNCFSCCASFAFVAKAIGYDNVYACSTAGYTASHGWTEINGLIYDIEWERHHSGSYFGIKYDTNRAQDHKYYKQIFSVGNPYARVKL